MSLWVWNPATQRYRVTAEGAEALGQAPGTFVGQARMLQFRDQMIDIRKDNVNALARQLASGDMNLNQWTLSMRQQIKDDFITQYTLAHGGRNSMTQADWGRIGQMVRGQYGYLDSFANDIANGKYTEQGIAARARMYVESSGQAFERGKTAGRGMPDLSQYPGDGRTICGSNCKCRIQIKETKAAWLVYWRLSNVDHCTDCVYMARVWNPLTIPKPQAA